MASIFEIKTDKVVINNNNYHMTKSVDVLDLDLYYSQDEIQIDGATYYVQRENNNGFPLLLDENKKPLICIDRQSIETIKELMLSKEFLKICKEYKYWFLKSTWYSIKWIFLFVLHLKYAFKTPKNRLKTVFI